ncbi:MAG: FMN-binding glutamate synthase family protein [Bdellovibrionota bacterium]
MARFFFFGLAIILLLSFSITKYIPQMNIIWVIIAPMVLVALWDFFQKKSAIKRNFPIIGRFRYLFEMVRPEIQQYFIEANSEGMPFSREVRSVIYQRSKKALETLPFGTQKNLYEDGYEWANHSLMPTHVKTETLRVKIGETSCQQPYNASIFNISAMSFGSLSKNAIMALNKGAHLGNFSHNTGEGGISPYHLQGGDLVWQLGTAYFGSRTREGKFCPSKFQDNAQNPVVKMIEIKLSQGAKPGHGGILPAGKLTKEVAEIRGVPLGNDVISPPCHSEFSTPIQLIEFVQKLRELSQGKPVGFKLCLGKPREFYAICKAMKLLDCTPDFITVDGAEGGTGAAPLEFSNYIGTPLTDAIVLIHNALVGFDLRKKVKIIASGKITTGFDIMRSLALGADLCNSARGMMMSLGCIQALKCNTNHCPTGVATQSSELQRGLVVSDKKYRVYHYHSQTLDSFCEILGSLGVSSHLKLKPWHVMRRTPSGETKHFGRIYHYLNPGELTSSDLPFEYRHAVESASAETFQYCGG